MQNREYNSTLTLALIFMCCLDCQPPDRYQVLFKNHQYVHCEMAVAWFTVFGAV